MTFIITLISLVIERFFHWSHLRNWRWFGKYQRWMDSRLSSWPSALLLILLILPLLIIVGLINCLLDGHLYEIPKIIFGTVILLYCMGPNNLWVQTYSCIKSFNNEDPSLAVNSAQSAFGINFPNNSQAFHQALTGAIFIEANRRVFAVLFWFAILGPIGAVLYRVAAICAEDSRLAHQLQTILDWIPVRLFTFIFALGGHFTEVFAYWRKDAKKGLEDNNALLTECGIAALDVREENILPEDGTAEKSALELLDRVFLMWLVILAVVVIMVK